MGNKIYTQGWHRPGKPGNVTDFFFVTRKTGNCQGILACDREFSLDFLFLVTIRPWFPTFFGQRTPESLFMNRRTPEGDAGTELGGRGAGVWGRQPPAAGGQRGLGRSPSRGPGDRVPGGGLGGQSPPSDF
jgi:hypothetical protein